MANIKFDEIKRGATGIADRAVKKTGEMTNLVKLKVSIKSAEAKLRSVYEEIGRLFYTADRMAFIVKEQGQTGYNLMIYDRRPPEPQKPPIDPAQFVTWDGLEKRLEALNAPRAQRSALNNGGEQ